MAAVATLLNRAHNQIITAPDPIYTGSGTGELTAPNPSPTGPNNGWLIVVAPSRYACTVDLSDAAGGELRFGTGDWNVLFVGFRFLNGYLDRWGKHLYFWYCDFAFDTATYLAQRYYLDDRVVDFSQSTNGRAEDVRFYGCDYHNTVSPFRMSKSKDCINQGGRWYAHPGTITRWDGVKQHGDAISGQADGGFDNFQLLDFDIDQRIIFRDANTGSGTITDLALARGWLHDSDGLAVEYTSHDGGVYGTCDDVFMWAHNGARRGDDVDGVERFMPPESNANWNARVQMIENNVRDFAPSASATSPMTLWRNAHPYDSWRDFDGFASFLATGPVVATTRRTRDGDSPGTIGNNWTSAQLAEDWFRLSTFGDWVRVDINWANVYAAGWRSTSSTTRAQGWGRYDSELRAILGFGTKNVVLCCNQCPSVLKSGVVNGYPLRANQADWEAFCEDVVTRYAPGNGVVPADGDTIAEIWNEPNTSGKNAATGESDYVEYAWLYKAACDAIKGVDPSQKVIPGGPAPSLTAVNAGEGSNQFGFAARGAGAVAYSPYDWYRNLLVDPAGLLNTTTNPKLSTTGAAGSTTFDGLGVHPYSSSEGPLGTHGTLVNTTQAYDFNAFRLNAMIFFLAAVAGNDGLKCKLHATEIGYDTAPYWASGSNYVAGQVVYVQPGSLNPNWVPRSTTQPRWSRSTRYKCSANHTAGATNKPGTAGGASFWAVHSSGDTSYDIIPGSSVYEENEAGQAMHDALAVWYGDMDDADGVDISGFTGVFCVYQHRDLKPLGVFSEFNGHMGLVDFNGREKGSPANPNGPYRQLVIEGMKPLVAVAIGRGTLGLTAKAIPTPALSSTGIGALGITATAITAAAIPSTGKGVLGLTASAVPSAYATNGGLPPDGSADLTLDDDGTLDLTLVEDGSLDLVLADSGTLDLTLTDDGTLDLELV